MTDPDYLVLAHNNVDRLARLVTRLHTGSNQFFVHFDRGGNDEDFARLIDELRDIPCTFIRRRYCRWGRYGLVSATLDGIREFVAKSTASHVVLVSGADYPVKSRRAIAEFFDTHPSQSFMRTWAIPRPGWSHGGGTGRFDRWYFGRRFPLPPARLVKAGHGPRRMPAGLKPFGGWQWFALDRRTASWLLRYLDSNPKVERFFKTTHIPDELMLQTVLRNSPMADDILDSVHYVDWTNGGLHPRTLEAADVPELVTSTFLYARKFADEAVLDEVERTLADGSERPEFPDVP